MASLVETIDYILNGDQHSVAHHEKQQIISSHEHAIFWQAFLEDFPEKADSLEERIRDAHNDAENTGPSRAELDLPLIKVETEIANGHKTKDVSDSSAASSSSGAAPSKKDAMVGFDDDLMAIKDRLCGESTELQVIPIVGMGGIGKTTLAKNAYYNQLIMEHFEVCGWVRASQDNSVQEIISGLLVSMKEFITGRIRDSDEGVLYKLLKCRKYLIVIDDIWSTKTWDDLHIFFPNDHNGSRIMLTTRILDVAIYPKHSTRPFQMHFIGEDQSWYLLRQKVFAQQDCPPQLENIGKEIARSCRGLPLAIVVIAGLLSRVSKTPDSWRQIAENVNSVVAIEDEHFEKILSLSYTHLPHHLRPCFLYMGGFPKDHEIRVSKLIKLWAAEGFLKRPNGSKSLEETAEEYLEDLVKRSLVLVTKRKFNGKIKCCSLHDLMRDLCIRKAQEIKFRLRVVDVDKVLEESIKVGSLGDVSFLRVLAMGEFNPCWISVPTSELFNLRYLALPYFVDIPATISTIQYLQTFIIYPTEDLVRLPPEIWRMPELRHLVSLFGALPCPEGATSFALENLQTLLEVKNLECTDRIVKMIPNIKKLGIVYFPRDEDEQDYHLDNLVYLDQLEKLKVQVYPGFKGKLDPVFPSSLKKLTLSGWGFAWKDMTIVGSLPNLQVLKLCSIGCQGDRWETSEGEFLQLKYLLIVGSDLQDWITERDHFPSLKYLLLHCCWHLSGISNDIGDIPTLELIEVKGWNKSLVDSAKRIEEEQQDLENDALQVRFIHY